MESISPLDDNNIHYHVSNYLSGEIGYSPIGDWDVSGVTDMYRLFKWTNFNEDISNWNVENVKNMDEMFYGAQEFNQDISGWNVSSVTSMTSMFDYAKKFNQYIGGWDTSNVTYMNNMFDYAQNFNQDIGGWDTSKVTTMQKMFDYAQNFNQDISGWDTSKVTNMSYLFCSAKNFNQDIGGWDTSKVTNMSYLFSEADSFNQDIRRWNVSGVTTMENMFFSADSFNQDIRRWIVSDDTILTNMFGFLPQLDNYGFTIPTPQITEFNIINNIPTGIVTISGELLQGEILTANISDIQDLDGLGDFNYQWISSDSSGGTSATTILGYTDISYTLTQSDVGNYISVIVSYTDGYGTTEDISSGFIGPIVNVNDLPVGIVTISGELLKGEILTANISDIQDLDGLGDFNYQWISSDSSGGEGATTILGYTDISYTLTQSDVGNYISVIVSYTDGYGTTEDISSGFIGPIVNVNDILTGIVTISGELLKGEILTANISNIQDLDDLDDFNYQWISSDSSGGEGATIIQGATDISYTLRQTDIDNYISVIVSYTDVYVTENISSAFIGPIVFHYVTQVENDSSIIQEIIVNDSYIRELEEKINNSEITKKIARNVIIQQIRNSITIDSTKKLILKKEELLIDNVNIVSENVLVITSDHISEDILYINMYDNQDNAIYIEETISNQIIITTLNNNIIYMNKIDGTTSYTYTVNNLQNGTLVENEEIIIDNLRIIVGSLTIENIQIITSNICFLGNSIVKTDQGEFPIEKLKYETLHEERFVRTKTKFLGSHLIVIEKDALGINIPNKTTIITPEHKVFINGVMTEAKKLINNDTIYKRKYKGEYVYNILQEEHTDMYVNNMLCETLDPTNSIRKLYTKNASLNDIIEYNKMIKSLLR